MQSHPYSFSTAQIETNKFPWNSSCLQCYIATPQLYKLCAHLPAHLFSNIVYYGHTLFPIIGIYPHVKYPYSSGDLMASWSCFLWIWELGRKRLGNAVCRPVLVAWRQSIPFVVGWLLASWLATEWHIPRLACDVLNILWSECYLIKYCIIGLFWI